MRDARIENLVRDWMSPARIQRQWENYCRENAPLYCWGRELFAPPSPEEQVKANHNALLHSDVRRVARLA